MRKPIYLDYSATTPVDPRVAQKMSECLLVEGNFGNPASRSHVYGWNAEESVEIARAQVAAMLNCDPREIVWTSGATESDNLALKGVIEHPKARGRHIVTSVIEHKAVIDTCRYLEQKGCEVTWLKPRPEGWIDPDDVAAAMREDTAIVSIMHANNEIGVLSDIAAIGAIAHEHGAYFHTDAAQSGGKEPLDMKVLPVDLVSLSAHKMYGPKGIGALYVRREPPVRLVAQMHGGGHERNLRSGTLATHQIVGMGEAARIMTEVREQEHARILALRKRLHAHLSQMQGVRVNGDLERRLAGNLNVGFDGVDGETLLLSLAADVAVSSGSACTSATVEPSYVLRAIGVPDDVAHASLRFTVGRYTTAEEIDLAARRTLEVVEQLRTAADARAAQGI